MLFQRVISVSSDLVRLSQNETEIADQTQPVVLGVHDNTESLGWLAVLGAVICMGSFAVPMKSINVVEAQVHPLIYQTYKTFWAWITSHLILTVVPWQLSAWGILSGFLWVPAGAAAVIAVRNLGIACAQGLWQVTIIVNAFVWGVFILQDTHFRSWQMALLSALILAAGIVGMTLSFLVKKSHEEWDDYGATEKSTSAQSKSAAVGVAACLINGIWGGACLVPSKYAPYHGFHFVLSFAYGAVVANVALLVCYGIMSGYVWQQSFPSPQFKVMAVPGFISGSLWSLGNVCSLFAVDALGFGVGDSAIQSSLIVSGLWGIVLYQELSGKAILVWCLFLVLCALGVVGLATQKLSRAEEQGLLFAIS